MNIYAPNIAAPQYVRQTLTNMKGEINSNTITAGDFNTPLTPMDRSTKQKISKETQTLNDKGVKKLILVQCLFVILKESLVEWIQKQDPYICCLQETHLKTRDTYRLKVKGWKKIFHANRDQKKAGVAILTSDKIDFKTKAVKRDKEGHYIMIKGSI